MRKPVVILHSDVAGAVKAAVMQDHADLELHTCETYDGLVPMVNRTGAEVVYTVRFAGTPNFPRAGLLAAPSLRWISVGGSGTDHLRPWDQTRITVTNAAGVAAGMMAEYALGAMLHFSLGFGTFARDKAAHRWRAGQVEPIAGRTLLIVGFGKTGQAAAQRARALGLKVIAVRANPAPSAAADEVHGIEALPRLWPQADFILCCVPLLETTRGLIGATAFAAMKPAAVLIDVSRGGVVHEGALVDALRSRRIRGAALDVFATEPLPQDHPLWEMDNVIITPHCSSVYDGWDIRSADMFSANLSRYRRGEPLLNVVDPQRGY